MFTHCGSEIVTGDEPESQILTHSLYTVRVSVGGGDDSHESSEIRRISVIIVGTGPKGRGAPSSRAPSGFLRKASRTR